MITKPLFNFALTLMAMLSVSFSAIAQPTADTKGGTPSDTIEGMTLCANDMDPKYSQRITEVADTFYMQGKGLTRAFVPTTLEQAKFSLGNSLIDIIVNEVFSIATYKKQQRTNWETMIKNECNYTDSILSIQGNTDFYSENSLYGPLDPADINFDGITLTNSRKGQQFFYMKCRIDTTRIGHLFQHSKFYLVLDSVYFNPYLCHLPNLKANNIERTEVEQPTRNLDFSFNERGNLCVSIDLTLTSSWINEAVMVMQDVELGKFSFKINIERTEEGQPYIYSRATAKKPIQIQGESFIVPRSYMPLSNNVRMWGTGEYKMKVCFRESCKHLKAEEDGLKANKDEKGGQQTNEDDFDWKDDYKQLRKMQKKSSGWKEIFETIYKQDGNTVYKTLVKSGVTSTLTEMKMVESSGNAVMP